MVLRVELLGEVAAYVAGRPVVVGPARQRLVLAALAVDADHVVSLGQLVDRVWGAEPPLRARGVLSSYVSRLRQVLGTSRLVRRSGGYVLVADRSQVDLRRFHDLCDQARGCGDDGRTVELLTEALALWRGDPLTGLDSEWVLAERDRLHQQRRLAERDLTDARLRAGHGDDLVAELFGRVIEHPLDERVAAQYMVALYRDGRAADALEHYRLVRARLRDQLGTDPSTELEALHQRLLDTPAAPFTSPAARQLPLSVSPSVPRQLPAAPRGFTGRVKELAALDDTHGTGPIAVITAIGGAGGIGKTSLALHWAHHHLDRFPDGQLFVDLRGFSPDSDPLAPLTAVRGFLDALGADSTGTLDGLDELAARYRSRVAGKRMLIVLDNAATAEQVAPLLPGTSSCTVLITSRNTLNALLHRYGANHISLAVLDNEEARALLAFRLGDARLTAEPDATAALIRACGRYPLALAIIASRAQTDPGLPLAEVATELGDCGLDALDDADPMASLPEVLSWSFNALTPEQRTTFALLGIAPGTDISLRAAANLTAFPPAQTRKILRQLVDASLLTRHAPDRYVMHDLVRDYATGIACRDFPAEAREAALRRTVDFYLHTAHTAGRLIEPNLPLLQVAVPDASAHPHPLPDATAAMDWFGLEHTNLMAVQRSAAGHSWRRIVWQMAAALSSFHVRRGRCHDELTVWQFALDAVTDGDDPTVRTGVHWHLGGAYQTLNRHEEAIEHLHLALALAEHHHNPTDQGLIHKLLAREWNLLGDSQRGLGHAMQALDLFRPTGPPMLQASAHIHVCWCHILLGDYETARDHCQAALRLIGNTHPGLEAIAEDRLGYIAHHTGHHRQAVRRYRRALTLFRDIGHSSESANTLDNLGHPYKALGEYGQARAVWQEALELYRQQERADDAHRLQQQLATVERSLLSSGPA